MAMSSQQFTFIAGLLFVLIGITVFAVIQMSHDSARNRRLLAGEVRRAISNGPARRPQPPRIASAPRPLALPSTAPTTGRRREDPVSADRPRAAIIMHGPPTASIPASIASLGIVEEGPSSTFGTADIHNIVDFVDRVAGNVQSMAGAVSSTTAKLQRTQDSLRRTAAAATAAAATAGDLVDSTIDAVSSGVLEGFTRSGGGDTKEGGASATPPAVLVDAVKTAVISGLVGSMGTPDKTSPESKLEEVD